MENTLTINQAYLAMFAFLETYYNQTKSDDVANILTGLSLMSDGLPFDRGFYQEWMSSVSKVKIGEINAGMDLR